MEDKRIVEVIHANKDIRSYGITKLFEIPEYGGYHISTKTELSDEIRPLFEALWAMPAIERVSLSRAEISIELTSAYKDRWETVSPLLLDLINQHFFAGEATTHVRDESMKYARSSHYEEEM